MPKLAWTDDLAVGVAFIDDDHRAFIEALAAIADAPDAALAELFDALLIHTEEHFAREEAEMKRINFFATETHVGEHGRVLQEMRRFRNHLAKGNTAFARQYLTEQVPGWFYIHRNTMDQATAARIREAE